MSRDLHIRVHNDRPRCWYCGGGWFVLRWTPVMETPFSPSRWVCLHHTFKHLREA